jgi:hypothetical protein
VSEDEPFVIYGVTRLPRRVFYALTPAEAAKLARKAAAEHGDELDENTAPASCDQSAQKRL